MRTEYRIELEENIMDCWRVVDDIRVVQTMHQDMGELSVDDMSIILMGIQKLYSLKFQLLFEVFEKHLKALHDNKTAKDGLMRALYVMRRVRSLRISRCIPARAVYSS